MEQNNHKTSQMAAASEEKKIAMQVSAVSIVINLILSIFKLLAGIFAKSGAMMCSVRLS